MAVMAVTCCSRLYYCIAIVTQTRSLEATWRPEGVVCICDSALCLSENQVNQQSASAGFMLPRPYTPDWWLWFTYITPPGWSILAITVDQAGSNVCLVPFLCLACC